MQHCCFTCGPFLHVMCSYTITIKETGKDWDNLDYPENYLKCNSNPNPKNQTISTKKSSKDDFTETVENENDKLKKKTIQLIFSPR